MHSVHLKWAFGLVKSFIWKLKTWFLVIHWETRLATLKSNQRILIISLNFALYISNLTLLMNVSYIQTSIFSMIDFFAQATKNLNQNALVNTPQTVKLISKTRSSLLQLVHLSTFFFSTHAHTCSRSIIDSLIRLGINSFFLFL